MNRSLAGFDQAVNIFWSWMDGGMDGWMDGGMDVKAVLGIACSVQKPFASY
jgi:rhodanese-related sulfurtransferase